MKNLCILPWTHFASEPTGTTRPCCIAFDMMRDGDTTYNIATHSVQEIFHSPYMKKLRQQFREGVWPDTCKVCKKNEENGVLSKRQQHNEWLQQRNIQPPDYKSEPQSPSDFQIILSNKCNLKCRTCNGIYSTKWAQEATDRKLFNSSHVKEFKELHVGRKLIDSLDEWISPVRHIEYMGGEPVIQDEFIELTEKIIQKQKSSEIKLSFSSNVSVNALPILKRLRENFSYVSLNLSIDGIGPQFEYMRYGAKWKVVEENIRNYVELMRQHQNFYTSVTHTVSWLNVYYVPEFLEQINLIAPELKIFINLVYNPEHLNAAILPDTIRSEVIKKLNQYATIGASNREAIENLMQHMQNGNYRAELFGHGLYMNADCDRYRNESYSKIFPDFGRMLESYLETAKLISNF